MKSISYQMDELDVLPYLCNNGKDGVTYDAIYTMEYRAGIDETCEQTQHNRTRSSDREPTAQPAR
jgi:hypothetical protein